jgi:hypothetical protein
MKRIESENSSNQKNIVSGIFKKHLGFLKRRGYKGQARNNQLSRFTNLIVFFTYTQRCIKKGGKSIVKLENVCKLIYAAHYSYLVASPASERGGIFLISGANNLKSSIVEASLSNVRGALCYSDLTLKQLAVIRSEISAGMYHTLGFSELEKLYARNPAVASNLEGVVKAMVAEGFSHFAFEDKRLCVPKARCFVVASVLESLFRLRGSAWLDNGFLRRFICIKYSLSQSAKFAVMDAIHLGERVELPGHMVGPTSTVKYDVSKAESIELLGFLGEEYPTVALTLLQKCLCVLKWHYRQLKSRRGEPTPMERIKDLESAIKPQSWGILDL